MHTHVHIRSHMCTHTLTRAHILRPETKVLTWLPGAGPGLCPWDPVSISFLPPLPLSLPQMFAVAPASRPDVLDALGCLRDPEAGGVSRLPPDVSTTQRHWAERSQTLERDPSPCKVTGLSSLRGSRPGRLSVVLHVGPLSLSSPRSHCETWA